MIPRGQPVTFGKPTVGANIRVLPAGVKNFSQRGGRDSGGGNDRVIPASVYESF
jgi:hypothetical protein